jgi:hypothetical protein
MDSPQQPDPTDRQTTPEPADVLPEPAAVPETGAAPEPAAVAPEPATDVAPHAPVWAGYVGQSTTVAPFHDPDATPPFGTPVPRRPKPADPFAVAVGNASLLGIGYFLLGRAVLGVIAVLGTVLLLVLHLTSWPTLWFEFVVAGWWLLLVVHGFLLARPRPRPQQARGQWIVALAVALPVLLVFGLLRFDAAGIDRDAAAARADGSCADALAATDRLWFGNRLANAPLAERADDTVAACDRLRTADRELAAGLSGDTGALADGFGRLQGVLTELPGHEQMVRSTVNRFLDGLPTDDPCRTTTVTDWLREEEPGGALRAAADVVPGVAPAAIVECADGYMASSDWQHGREYYQQLLDEYPDHDLAAKAQQGVVKATQAIELANVRSLLTTSGGAQPAYCSTPAPYSGAKPYVPNRPNRSLLFGNEAFTRRIPAGWRAKDAADAVAVLCAGEAEYGAPVATCPYEADTIAGYVDVTFHKVAIPLKLYEVRTGKLISDFRVEIGGSSCPAVLEYSSYSYVDLGPPSQVYVVASAEDVRAAFRPLLVP